MDKARKLRFMSEYAHAIETQKKKEKNKAIIKKLSDSFIELGEKDLVNGGKNHEIDYTKHKPADVSHFLDLFRQSDLKYLTHDFDKPGVLFERETILNNAKKIFETKSQQYVIPASLYSRIKLFAFGPFGKNEDWIFNKKKYNLNWYSKDVINWCKKNPNMHPLHFKEFEENAILPFKQSIEIKSPQLETLVNEKVISSLGSMFTSFTIIPKDLDKPNFYTDVDKMLAGIGAIISSIRGEVREKENDNKEIIIEFIKKRSVRTIKITHLNSECNKPLDKSIFKGNLSQAYEAFYQICDWSILSINPSEYNKLNILFNPNGKIKEKEKVDVKEIKGFTHELKFYV